MFIKVFGGWYVYFIMYILYVIVDIKIFNLIFSIVYLVFRNLLWLKESVKLYKN